MRHISLLACLLFLLSCTTTKNYSEQRATDLVKIKDLEFSVRQAGPKDGELVILLHGFPQTSYSYKDLMKTLADEGYRVLAPNQRGYSMGASPYEVSAYRIDLLVQDVLDLADHQGAKKFHLVGHDWGAVVSWTLAERHPERLKSLTSLSIPHLRAFKEAMADPKCNQAKKSSYIKTFVQEGSENIYLRANKTGLKMIYKDLPESDKEFYLDYFGRKQVLRTALNWYRAYFGPWSPQKPLGKIRTSTLFVWGAQDMAVGECGVKNTYKYMTKGKYTQKTLAESGHWLLESNPKEIAQWTLAHLRKN